MTAELNLAGDAPGPELPNNVEAEAALLGGLMIDNRLVDQVADYLTSDHFFEPLHGRIYDAIVREHNLQRTANPITLRPYFIDDEAAKEVGGPKYLAQLTGSGAAVIGAVDFAKQVLEMAQLRQMIGVAREIEKRAADTSERTSFAELATFAESEIALVAHDTADGLVELSAGEAAARAIRAGENPALGGILSGISPIDEAIGPIRRKDLIIVAARPGMGKSVVATGYAVAAARRSMAMFEAGEIPRPYGILLFSLEMTAEQLGARMLSDMTLEAGALAVPYEFIESGKLHMKQSRRVMEAQEELARLPLQIIDIGQATTGRMNALIRRWKRRFAARGIDLELCIVDYLQKLKANEKTRDLYERITAVAQDVKTSAKVNDVGMMALAQLSRAVETRPDKRPQLSDLRDSGQIEQEADTVLFLFRSEYYLAATEPPLGDDGREKWEAALEACRHRMEFICAKRRQGQTGKRFGNFHGAFAAVRESL
jgi:replicative DNA helicase